MSENAISTPPYCDLKNASVLPATAFNLVHESPAGLPSEHTASPSPKSPRTANDDANALTMGTIAVGESVGAVGASEDTKSRSSRRPRRAEPVCIELALNAPKSRRIKPTAETMMKKRPARARYENRRLQIRLCIQNELCDEGRAWTPEIDRQIMDKPAEVSWGAYRMRVADGMFPIDELRGRWRWLMKHDGEAKSRKRWTRAEDELLLSGKDVPGRDRGACRDRLYKLRKAIA